jgi:pimeloyl-ACP methyl ester carboxylesterase
VRQISRTEHDQTRRAGLPYPDIDVVLEQIAHRFVYHDTLSAEDQQQIGELGYQAWTPLQLPGDLQIMGLQPLPDRQGVAPVLAFRGTSSVDDLIEDANQEGVGMFQFCRNEPIIVDKLQTLGGRVMVTGHSLGGALAQIASALHPDLISGCVTFQAPGISTEVLERMRATPEGRRLEAATRHHVVDECVVSRAGDAHTPGEVIHHHMDGAEPPDIENLSPLGDHPIDGPLGAHTSMPVTEEATAHGVSIPGVGFGDASRRGYSEAPTIGGEQSHALDEGVRSHVLGVAADRGEEAYVTAWMSLRTEAETGTVLYSALVREIDDLQLRVALGTAPHVDTAALRSNLDSMYPELRAADGLEGRVRDGTFASVDDFVGAIAAQMLLDTVRRTRLGRYFDAVKQDEARSITGMLSRALGL